MPRLYTSKFVRAEKLPRHAGWTALLYGHKLSRVISGPDLTWTRDLLLWISKQLHPLRQPACRPWNREEHGEHLRFEAHGFVHDAGIEIDVRIKLAAHEVIVFECDAFQFQCDFD